MVHVVRLPEKKPLRYNRLTLSSQAPTMVLSIQGGGELQQNLLEHSNHFYYQGLGFRVYI